MRTRIALAFALIGAAPLTAFAQADVTLPRERDVAMRGSLTASHAPSNHGPDDRGSHQHYFYSGTAGHNVSITAFSPEGSRMLRVAIALYAPQRARFVADDGGQFEVAGFERGWFAEISGDIPETGVYVICVHSHSPWATGDYILTVYSPALGT